MPSPGTTGARHEASDGVAENGAERLRALFGRSDVQRLALVNQWANPVSARAGPDRLREARHNLADSFNRKNAGIDRLAARRLLPAR